MLCRLLSLSAPILGLTVLASCSGLGSVPEEVITLYDIATPDGTIEIELNRDASVRELEADVPVDMVPAKIRDAAMTQTPGGRITGAEREFRSDGPGWEIKMRHEGRAMELVYDDDANLVEIERELRHEEAPAQVIDAANRAVPQGQQVSVEIIERGEEVEYHIKKRDGDTSYKVVLAPDGSVIRAVREARAEIEIPLR